MDPKRQADKARSSYFGNIKNRLGDRLPVSITQPSGFTGGGWASPPCSQATGDSSMARHHIRNPKLRQYYLKDAAFPDDTSAVESESGNEPGQRNVPQCKASATMATPLDPRRPASEPRLEAVTPTTPVSPSTDAEYDKLLDVEAVPMPDGQLCLLALPPECTQGEGPQDMPYLKLFCRLITDRKGIVSGILLVTANKIFFDPHKTLPLVQENGWEQYLFSCLVDNLTSVTFFSDVSHVCVSQSAQRWKGRKKVWKCDTSKYLVRKTQSTSQSAPPPPQKDAVPLVTAPVMSEVGAGPGEDEGGEIWDMAEVERQLEGLALESGGVAGAGMLNTAATFCCGGANAVGGANTEPTQVHGEGEQAYLKTGLTARPSLMFVRMRQKQLAVKRRGFGSLELSRPKTTPPRDTWFALQQEKWEELRAYLSQYRPDLCILEGTEEEEAARDEDDFVLLDNGEEGEEREGSPKNGHNGDEWEMVCVEDNRTRACVSVDRDPDGLQDILKQSLILDAKQVRELVCELPARTVGRSWKLAYSTSQDGSSLRTLYRRLSASDSPVLLLIRDDNHQVFGAFLSHSLHPSEKFYGTGETFLFLLYPRFKCFRWTGENSFFIKGDLDSFAIGGGSGHFGLWLDETLYLGRSSPCFTFNNCSLSETSDFRVLQLEAWTFW